MWCRLAYYLEKRTKLILPMCSPQIRSLAQCDFDCEIPLNHKWPFLNLMAILTECGHINVTKLGEGAQNGPRDPEVFSTMW